MLQSDMPFSSFGTYKWGRKTNHILFFAVAMCYVFYLEELKPLGHLMLDANIKNVLLRTTMNSRGAHTMLKYQQ